MSASNHAFSALSFVTFILVLVPLPWHLEAWNMGTVSYIIWTALATLNYFINSVIWDDSTANYAPVWCDISAKLMVGAAFGIPCAVLCINKRLYCIASAQTATAPKKDRMNATVVDLAICLGVPILMMILHFVVQQHRFYIYQEIGCLPGTYNVTLQYVLIQGPLLLIPVVSAVYALMGTVSIRRYDGALNETLASRASSITLSRYWRLLALASFGVVIGFPLTLTVMLLNIKVSPVQPWISWEDTHRNFLAVDRIPSGMWRSNAGEAAALELNRYLPVVYGFIFVAVFGFGKEARKNYKTGVGRLCRAVGAPNPFKVTRSSKFTSSFGSGIGNSHFAKFKISTPGTEGNESKTALPIYVQTETVNKRDSFDTMSDFTSVNLGGDGSPPKKVISQNQPGHSPSPSPALRKPRIEISSAIYPKGFNVEQRAPESSFPASVTPEVSSFLEMATPVPDGVFAKVASNADSRLGLVIPGPDNIRH